MLIPAIVAGTLGLAGGLFSAGTAAAAQGNTNKVNKENVAETNTANKEIAQMNLDYQREYNNQIFAREDNAVQRAAADLQAAGLSKTLAAGSRASAGGSASAPMMNYQEQAYTGYQSPLEKVSQLTTNGLSSTNAILTMLQSQQAQSAQIAHLNAQTESLNIDNAYKADLLTADLQSKNAQIDHTRTATRNLNTDDTIKNYDFNFAKRSGLMYSSNGMIGDTVKAILGVDDATWKKYGERLVQLFSPVAGGIDSTSGAVNQIIEKSIQDTAEKLNTENKSDSWKIKKFGSVEAYERWKALGF